MAEAAGLAVGAVALASLFQTCVEFLEYFEVARNLSEDGELISTKLHLLETRLRSWECRLNVLDPSREDGGWHMALANELEGGIIGRCLVGISDIIGDASKLKHKYGLDKRKRVDWGSCFPFLLRPPQKAKTTPSFGLVSLRRHVVWAVRDKKRFDSLVQDLDFFITNLEKVGSHLVKSQEASMSEVSTIQKLAKERHGRASHPPGVSSPQGQRRDNEPPTNNSSQHMGAAENMNVRQNQPKGHAGDGRTNQQVPIKQTPSKGSNYTNQHSKGRSHQFVGAIGNVKDEGHVFDGNVSHDQSMQNVGPMSDTAYKTALENQN